METTVLTTLNPLIASTSLLFTLFFVLTTPIESTAAPCYPASCDPTRGPQIRFPFRLVHRQPANCGFPGFDLSCDPTTSKTILALPRSGKFVVDDIDYRAQSVLISDPQSCLANRSLNFSLRDSPFEGTFTIRYSLLNCSSSAKSVDSQLERGGTVVSCLSGRNYTVVAARGGGGVVGGCGLVKNVSMPLVWTSAGKFGYVKDDFELEWTSPDCSACENDGGVCGFVGDDAYSVGCDMKSRNGLSKSAKYAIIISGVTSATIGILGLACCAFGKMWILNLRHLRSSDSSTATATAAATSTPTTGVTGGLDLPTIQSYPKAVLGQSGRLPKPGEKSCAICLCEYEPKETLKTIPDCNHFFHEDCVDEWLKINGTCPLCRSSLESSSRGDVSSTSLLSDNSSLPDNR